MKKKTIKYNNFGTNNYSAGMELVTFNPVDFDHNMNVMAVNDLPGFFLHPFAEPNSCEIFAVKGTQEQFDVFYKEQLLAQAASLSFKEIPYTKGEPLSVSYKRCDLSDEYVQTLTPWYTTEKLRARGILV